MGRPCTGDSDLRDALPTSRRGRVFSERAKKLCVVGLPLFGLGIVALALGLTTCDELSLEGRLCQEGPDGNFMCLQGYSCCPVSLTCQRSCPDVMPPLVPSTLQITGVQEPTGDEVGKFILGQGDKLTSLAIDTAGIHWVGSRCGGLFRDEGFPPKSVRVFDAYSLPIMDSGVSYVMIDRDGNKKWVASRRGFLYSFDGAVWNTYSDTYLESGSLPHRPVIRPGRLGSRVLAQGPDNAVWFVARSGGVARMLGFAITHVMGTELDMEGAADAAVSEHVISALMVDAGGTLWVGGNKGLLRLDNGSGKLVSASERLPAGATVNDILLDPVSGHPLVATDQGLFEATPTGPAPVSDTAPVLWAVNDGERMAMGPPDAKSLVAGVRGALNTLPIAATAGAFDHLRDLWVLHKGEQLAWALGLFGPEGGFQFSTPSQIVDPRLFWRIYPIQALDHEEAIPLADALKDPHKFIGQRIHIRGSQHGFGEGEVRFLDETDRVIEGVSPGSTTLAWLTFDELHEELALSPFNPNQDYYGFLEIGGCSTSIVGDLPLQLALSENYPISMNAAERTRIRALYRDCITSGACLRPRAVRAQP